jgi:DNA-directed RNA polymerase subunit RPC12/RpoP
VTGAGDPREDPGPTAVSCARCGEVAADGPPLGWSSQSSGRTTAYVCVTCSRAALRAIEGRLGEEWWPV